MGIDPLIAIMAVAAVVALLCSVVPPTQCDEGPGEDA